MTKKKTNRNVCLWEERDGQLVVRILSEEEYAAMEKAGTVLTEIDPMSLEIKVPNVEGKAEP